jgi:lipid-A-disaccharide synthase
MQRAGADVSRAFSDEPIIGLSAVLPRIFYYRRLLRDTVERLKSTRTDVLVLVDYPGFNLRLADAAKRAGIKTAYYIGPQIWAWGGRRIQRIKRAVDLMLVVFDFERELYEKAGVAVRYVGHPLLDELDFTPQPDFHRRYGFDPERPLLGLFPGSRPAEVRRVFPVMVRAAERVRAGLGDVGVACAMAPGLERAHFEAVLAQTGTKVTLLSDMTHALMQASDLALVTSGTATLETALFGTPELVLYRTDPLTAAAARLLLRVSNIGLVNLVARREIAPEFVQRRCHPEIVARAALACLKNKKLSTEYAVLADELKERLGQPGAAERAAHAILEIAQL